MAIFLIGRGLELAKLLSELQSKRKHSSRSG